MIIINNYILFKKNIIIIILLNASYFANEKNIKEMRYEKLYVSNNYYFI